MPKFGYSIFGIDPDTTARASAREIHVSPKAAREVCAAIKNLRINKAKEYLEEVAAKKRVIPYKVYKKKVGHKKGLNKFYAGKYPVKAAKEVLKVLVNLEANAEIKGLDVDGLKIVHAAAHRGRFIRKNIPRAFGRATRYYETLVHIELTASQLEIGEFEEVK